jgi:predicted amidohydrolase YtcJ
MVAWRVRIWAIRTSLWWASKPDPEYRGALHVPKGGPDAWRPMYLAAAQAGFQFQTHAVGDATLDEVLALHTEVASQVPLDRLRWAVLRRGG